MSAAPDINRFVRDGDPQTSLEAAIKARRASKKAVATVRAVMADGVERIDEEIWLASRKLGLISSFDVVRHARLALSQTGSLVDTERTGTTSDGRAARVWRTTEPVSRAVMELHDSSPKNAKRAFVDISRQLARIEAAMGRARLRLSAAALDAGALVLRSQENGNYHLESIARARLLALQDALKMLEEPTGA